jgi:hypothetical protein
VEQIGLSKRSQFNLKGKGQYTLAFFAIAGMLYFVGFPLFLLFFFGLLTFFIWKSFSFEPHGTTRQIFDFYLSASEILRNDQRRWFGFEIAALIKKGEAILNAMGSPPPLMYFALGALYLKAGDPSSAQRYLAAVSGESSSDESAIVVPTAELLDYVTMLRKIERDSANAPVMSAAVRYLERSRKNNAETMLDRCKRELEADPPTGQLSTANSNEVPQAEDTGSTAYDFAEFARNRRERADSEVPDDRRTISELLHDIYDERDG